MLYQRCASRRCASRHSPTLPVICILYILALTFFCFCEDDAIISWNFNCFIYTTKWINVYWWCSRGAFAASSTSHYTSLPQPTLKPWLVLLPGPLLLATFLYRVMQLKVAYFFTSIFPFHSPALAIECNRVCVAHKEHANVTSSFLALAAPSCHCPYTANCGDKMACCENEQHTRTIHVTAALLRHTSTRPYPCSTIVLLADIHRPRQLSRAVFPVLITCERSTAFV